MRGQKFFSFFLILVILGGLGYIAWSFFITPQRHLGFNLNNMDNMGNMDMNGHQTPDQTKQGQTTNPHSQTPSQNLQVSSMAADNKDRLNQAVTALNQALELITIDPYSKTTVLNSSIPNLLGNSNQGTGNGTINIYPSDNSSVSINSSKPNSQNNDNSPTINFVFDQNKLYQLHQRIYMLAQGMMLLDELNQDLTNQAAIVEVNPPDYQTYVNRYNIATLNKSKLSNIIIQLNQASSLININPYAHPNGYQYNVPGMEQLHQGIFKLSQAMTLLTKLNDQFSRQMSEAAYQIQMQSTAPIQHGTNAVDFNLILNIALILTIIIIILYIFKAIRRALKNNPNEEVPNE